MKRFLLSLVFLFLAALPVSAVTLCNNAYMNTSTTGTGTLTLTTAVSGYQSFLDCGITNAQAVRYRIFNGAAWEIGTGTYTTAGTTLSRTVLESSNADAAVVLTAGATVIVTALTQDLPSETTPIDSTVVSASDYFLVMEGGSVLERSLLSSIRLESFCLALSDEATAITTGTAKVTWRMPYAFTLTNIRGNLNTVSSSGSPIVDVNEAGTSVMTTNKVLIDVSELTSLTAVTAVTLTDTSLADDALMTADVDVAGTGAKGLKICLIGYPT